MSGWWRGHRHRKVSGIRLLRDGGDPKLRVFPVVSLSGVNLTHFPGVMQIPRSEGVYRQLALNSSLREAS